MVDLGLPTPIAGPLREDPAVDLTTDIISDHKGATADRQSGGRQFADLALRVDVKKHVTQHVMFLARALCGTCCCLETICICKLLNVIL